MFLYSAVQRILCAFHSSLSVLSLQKRRCGKRFQIKCTHKRLKKNKSNTMELLNCFVCSTLHVKKDKKTLRWKIYLQWNYRTKFFFYSTCDYVWRKFSLGKWTMGAFINYVTSGILRARFYTPKPGLHWVHQCLHWTWHPSIIHLDTLIKHVT